MRKSGARKLGKENIEIERERLAIERERLEFEKKEASDNKKFWRMNSGTRLTILVTAAASFLTAIVYGGQIYISKIGKDKEIAVSEMLKTAESKKLDIQNQREWNLSIAQFVMSNWKTLFKGTPDEQKVLAKIIPTIFPQDVSVALLTRLESTSPSASRAIWRQARTSIETRQATNVDEGPTKAQPVRVEAQSSVPPRNDLLFTPLSSSLPRIDDLTTVARFPTYASTSLGSTVMGVTPTWEQNGAQDSRLYLNPIYAKFQEENSNTTRPGRLANFDAVSIGDFKPTSISGLPLDAKPIQVLTTGYQLLDWKLNSNPDEINQVIRGLNSSVSGTINAMQSAPSGVSAVSFGVTMISGRVVDAVTGLPIANAVVQSDSPALLIGLTTNTDATGYFVVTISSWQRSGSSIKLRVNRDGYESAVREVTDSTQYISSLGIPLRKSANR